MNAIKVYENDNFRFSVYPDMDPVSPRENANIGVMVCGHARYILGDSQILAQEFESWEDELDKIKAEHKDAVIIPLRLYDHSGISVSVHTTYPYNDTWDSMMIGYIYADKKMMRDAGLKAGKDWKSRLHAILVEEVDDYDTYLRGESYSFVCEAKTVCPHCNTPTYEVEDACQGFMGDWEKSGLLDNLPDELKEQNQTKQYRRKECSL